MSHDQAIAGLPCDADRKPGRVVSAFGPQATAMEVIAGRNLHGQHAIVTGGGSGIGLETVRALASAGAHVTIAGRNLTQARTIAGLINNAVGDARVAACLLDLGDLSSIRRFCADWGERPIHVLINNAGVMASPASTTADGFEIHFGTNHLGHFLLSVLLTPALRHGAPARLISLSSAGHMRSGIDFDDPHFRQRPYDHLSAYGQSKTANALFAVEFDRRHRTDGIRAFSVMPGMVATNILRHLVSDELATQFGLARIEGAWADPSGALPFKTLAQGAATSVWATVARELDGHGGLYLQDCAEALPYAPGMPRGQGVKPHALDPVAARALWALSERETGLT